MKKKFILLAMMLLTLIGGVNLNVLNAQQQETIEIGEGSTEPTGTSYLNVYPFCTYYNYSMSQQIYTAEELGNVGVGLIKSVSFRFYTSNNINVVRTVDVYLKNVNDKNSFDYENGSGGNLLSTDWINLTNDDLVYTGSFTIASNDSWIDLNFKNDFYYEGANLMLCVVDKTGSYLDGVTRFYGYETSSYRCLTHSNDSNPYNVENSTIKGYVYSKNNQIRLTFESVADDIIPAAPTNLAVAECTHNSVSLTWTAGDEYAMKYNVHVYNNGAEITGSPFTSTETAYTVKGLDAETTYTFKVQSVRGNNLSENFSNEVSATTLEYNDPLVGKSFRIKALTYIQKYEGYYTYYYGPFDFAVDKYLYIANNDEAGVQVVDKQDSNAQKFTFEPTGVEGQYYLRSADGYYINCGDWNVSGYDESEKSPVEVVYLDDTQTQFYLTNGTGRHFKVETGYYDNVNFKPYCDAAQQYAAKWIVEELEFQAIATVTDEEIYDDQTTTLSVTAFDGSGYTYSWSPANGLSDATSANPTFTPTAAGEHTFTCTVTDTESGSTAEASVTVYVNARPALQLAVSADKELIYNDGETAVLTATVTEGTGYAPYTYSWTLNETEVGTEATYTFSNTTVGEYTLTCTVTDARNNTQTASTTIEVKDVSEKPLEIVLGTDNTGNAASADGYIPTNTFYNYSLTQQIYTKNEIGMDGNIIINSIAFKESAGQTTTRNLSIYIQNTSETAVNSLYSMNNNDLRFAGNVEFRPYEWTVVTLNTPFEYDASKNILLCVDDNTGSYVSGRKFATYYNGEGGSYYAYSDNTNFDPMDPSNGNGSSGSKNHIKLGYEIPAPKPENLVATPVQIHVGETTTLTWNELEGAVSYNIYVDGVLNGNTEELTYELSGLTYNLEPGHTIEVAAVYEDETESGKASVTVQVAGTFTLTVNVTDGTNPIKGATVEIDMTYAYDEFFKKLEMEVESETDEFGVANVSLPLLAKYYDEYDGMWMTPKYIVKASNVPYSDAETELSCADIDNLQTIQITLSLLLPQVNNIQVLDEEENNLDGDILEGTNIVLSWDAVEGADSYKVYTLVEDVEIKSETTIDPKYFVEGVEKGYRYAVSALFGDLESEKCYASLTVKGNGYFKGYVTDGTSALQGIQVKVSSEYGDASAVVTTDEEGYFIGEIMEGDNYILTISHSDYDEFISTPFPIVYQTEYDFETIELNAKPSSDVTSVTATVNGDNVDVEWTVEEATKYNVYRRLASAQDCGEMIAEEIEGTTYTDTQWTTVAPGTYQYGVSAFVEPQAQTRDTEVIFEEGFENGIGNWTAQENSWTVTSDYHNSGSNAIRYYCSSFSFVTRTLTSPNIQINELPNPRLSFYLINNGNNTPTLSVKINVKKNDEEYDQYDFTTISDVFDNFTKFEYSLEQYVGKEIQIVFLATSTFGSNTIVDDIVIYSEIPAVETQIVWSNEVEKKAPVMFNAYEDTDWNNPNNWNVKRLPTAEDEVVILTSVNISSEANANSLNIASGSIVTVDENGVLNVAAGITNNGSLVLNDGGQIFQNNANIYAKFNMGIENPTSWSEETSSKDGWQFISSPFNAAQISLFTGLFTPKSYDLYKYDGTQDLEWINHKSETEFEETFVNGRGYLASYETLTSVELAGYLYYAKSFTWDNLTHAEKDLANFHLLGNPFTFDMDMTAATYNNLVEGVAIVNNEGGYTYDVTTIPVGDGFFVKATGENPTLSYDAEAKATRGVKANYLNVIATSNAGKDNVVINLGGEKAGFNKLQNFNDAIATVYVQDNGANYGIYNCNADVQEIELNFNANQMGNYTISIEPNGKFQTVTLVDRFTGIETNMLVEDYHFTAMSGVNNNRFIVKLAVSDQQSAVSDNFVYQSGEDLIIDAEGTVQIIDVMGRVLLSDEVESTNNRINVSGFRNGTYMVRVINGSEVKVEKVVIY